jgi:hypothetical protein
MSLRLDKDRMDPVLNALFEVGQSREGQGGMLGVLAEIFERERFFEEVVSEAEENRDRHVAEGHRRQLELDELQERLRSIGSYSPHTQIRSYLGQEAGVSSKLAESIYALFLNREIQLQCILNDSGGTMTVGSMIRKFMECNSDQYDPKTQGHKKNVITAFSEADFDPNNVTEEMRQFLMTIIPIILNESGVDRFIMSPDFEVRPVGVQEMYVFSSTEERSGRFEKGASLRIEKQEDGPDIVIAFNIPPLRDHKDKGLYFRLKQAYVELRNRKAIKPQLWGHHGLQAVADFVGGSELETRVSSVENFFQALGRDAMRRSVNAEISKREENAREWLEAETRLILPPMRPGSDLKRAFERCRALKVKEGNSQEMVSAFGDEEAEDHGALEAALTVYNHANSLGLQHLDRNGRLFAVISAVMNFLNRNLDGISETVAEAEARFQAPLAKEQQLYDLYRTIELIHQFGLNLINKGLNAEGMEFVSFAQSMCVPVTRMATSFDTSGTIASLRNSDPLKVWERVATQLADRYAVREILPLDPDSVISQTRQEMVNERDGQEEVRPRSAAQRLAEDLDAARKRDAARRAGQQRES